MVTTLKGRGYMFAYRAYQDAHTAQAHVPSDSFQRKSIGGFLALAGAVELVAVNVYIPELAAGGFGRAGFNAKVAFAAPAFVDWRIQGF